MALLLGISGAMQTLGTSRWKMYLSCAKCSRFTQEERKREAWLPLSKSSWCQPIILNTVISSNWHNLSSISFPFYPEPNTKENQFKIHLTSELQHPPSVPHGMTALPLCLLLLFRNNYKCFRDGWIEIVNQTQHTCLFVHKWQAVTAGLTSALQTLAQLANYPKPLVLHPVVSEKPFSCRIFHRFRVRRRGRYHQHPSAVGM